MSFFRKLFLISILLLYIFLSDSQRASGQTLELIGGNTLNGAITGAVLGASSIKLIGTDNLTPLRTGVGAGVIGGLAVAVHDISVLPRGQQFYISGTFNDGTNSSIIILLDTVYGAIGGAVIGSAVMLLRDDPIVDGLQYGAGIGAWGGFGFGLLDAFSLSTKNEDFISRTGPVSGSGSLLNLRGNNYRVGLISAGLLESKEALSDNIVSRYDSYMEMFALEFKF